MATKTPTRVLTYLQLAIGMALFGSALPVAKLVTDHFPVFIASTLRTAIGALLLVPLSCARASV